MNTGLTANSTSLTTDIDSIYQRISVYLQVAKSNILQSINQEMVKAYWMIGYEIIALPHQKSNYYIVVASH